MQNGAWMFKLTFLGATGTVTGSKYLVETGSRRILIDCGLFQGYKQLRLRNWEPLSVDPKSIDAVVLTHAHLDHSGYLPLLIRNGFKGPVYSTSATRDLCKILLPDSGHLQEEEARYANKRRYSKHNPARPLYTQAEAEAALQSFSPVGFDQPFDLGDGLSLLLRPSGHILGSAFVSLSYKEKTLTFSGDIGRPGSATMVDPARIAKSDYLVVESTYGDRLHSTEDPEALLGRIVGETCADKGVVTIPSFAVGRAQTVLYYLARLKKAGAIPDVPVFLNSPMAINASNIFCSHLGEHRLTTEQCRETCNVAKYITDVEGSKALDRREGPMIIISASGMATGGRVVHHLKSFASDPRNAILFAGYQAGGTRGAALVQGAKELKIHGEYVPIRARVECLDMLSAHADYEEVLAWLREFEDPPRRTFITHGEPNASDSLQHQIEDVLGWTCSIPKYADEVRLA